MNSMNRLIRLTCFALIVASTVAASAAQHEFRLKKPDAQSVMLMGEFNGWKGQPMTKSSDGTWKASVSLTPGTHGYKFLVNGSEWLLDPANPERKTVDGVENSAVEIKDGDTAAPRPSASATAAASANVPVDFTVMAERKRFDFNRSGTNSAVTTKETWGYKVTLENNSFAAVSGLEVQYRQFKLDDTLKGKNLVSVPGSTKIDSIARGQRVSFDTTPLELEKFELRPDWFFADGSKAKTKDRLAGLWLRVLRDGEIIFEFQEPSDLKKNAKWE
jgi:hypothetical protein